LVGEERAQSSALPWDGNDFRIDERELAGEGGFYCINVSNLAIDGLLNFAVDGCGRSDLLEIVVTMYSHGENPPCAQRFFVLAKFAIVTAAENE
jgi:hypothetical protein